MSVNLEESISTAIRQLTTVLEAVATRSTSGTLSDQSYKFFELGDSLCAQLKAAKNLMATRTIVFDTALAYPRMHSSNAPDKFLYGRGEVAFDHGRYLLLQSYMATTWAMYDSLSKIAGVLCCTDSLAKHEHKSVKLAEHLLKDSEKNPVGSRVCDHLKGGYGWPIALSYKIRNWLIHDGLSRDGISLFKLEQFSSAPFELNDDAWTKISDECKMDYKTNDTHSRLKPFPAIAHDLLAGLQVCNQEIDEAMSFLLLWSVGAVDLQIRLLVPRDSV